MTVNVCDSARDAAEALTTTLVDIIRRHPALVLALPTGATPLPMYAALRRTSLAEPGVLAQVRTFNLDEFVGVDTHNPASYRAYMNRELFHPAQIEPERIEFLNGCATDLDDECARYERAIAEAGGIDVAVLGLGSNGHIGFNEPSRVLQARTHITTLEASTRLANARWFGDVMDRVPRQALSMGVGTILRARRIMLIATGPAKAAAVARLRSGEVTTQVPASLLQCHPDVTLWLDREAAGA